MPTEQSAFQSHYDPSHPLDPSIQNANDPSTMSTMEKEQSLFDKAQQHLKPSRLFCIVSYLYAERKLVVFFCAHFMCTLIVWL
jgi:hypothetical protein